ncbi:MAG: hypothetical protein RLZ45_292 [Verrucomicrobiota bacterium]|jgi:uncharacterized ferritin-like protein (DUF455 family)
MEIRDFAEQVLFGTTLEVKLGPPGSDLTDHRPGPSLAAPEHPGRPAGLRFKPPGERSRDFPDLRVLEQERERGRLLHFFANHELLATELMALALLRFPDAPPAFRRGVVQTLQEEQDHTRMYCRRMEECGFTFGEMPVSGYFWRAVSPMAHPMDFVAGLSLTFEQANLDFCRQFAAAFQAVGDDRTAGLLDGIYRDEIAHVAHGLKWFRRWKDPRLSDWEAFQSQLKFPLSPQRAKGGVLNVEGRRAAGLEPGFIAELDVFSQSKGRTPRVHVFNPFTDAHLAQGRSFVPGKLQRQLAEDLSTLPQFLARQDDLVLVPRRPSALFLSGLKKAGFPLPEFVEMGSDPARAVRELSVRKLGGLSPWAWGPDSLELLKPLQSSLPACSPIPGFVSGPGLPSLYSKVTSAALLGELLAEVGGAEAPWLCTREVVGRAVDSLPDALEVIRHFRQLGYVRLVAKEAWGVAGSNALRLWEPELLPQQHRWLTSTLGRGMPLVVEPWLDRRVDFSMQWEMRSDGLRLMGFTGLLADGRGQYQGNWVEPHPGRPPAAVLHSLPSGAGRDLSLWIERLRIRLETWLRAERFVGPLGIDAFLYCDRAGALRLKPIVEINPRMTFGRLALELMRYTHSGTHGRLRLMSRRQVEREGFSDFQSWAQAMSESHPLRFAGDPIPRIQSGLVCLNDPTRVQGILAVFDVGKRGASSRPSPRGSSSED